MQLHIHRVLIFVVTMLLVIHGLLGLILGGCELAINFTLKVLLQNSSSNSTMEPESTTASNFLKPLDIDGINQIIIGGLEIYEALIVCCVSCCDLWRMLRIMSGIYGIFIVLSAVNIYLIFEHRAILKDIVDDLESSFLTNFYNLYRDTHGSEAHARFTFEMNGAQALLGCCGVHNHLEYANASLWKEGPGMNLTVPPTCCRLERDSFLILNCVVFLQGPCMAHPTLNNSSIGRGCFQGILLAFRFIFFESLVWHCISVLLYFIILFLFAFQIRHWAKKTEDPFEGLRDGGFLKATQQFVQQMEVVDDKVEQENEENQDEDETQNVIGSLSSFFDVVILAKQKVSNP